MHQDGSASPPAANGSGKSSPMPGATAALLLLVAINLFNYVDRYNLAATLPKIEADLLPGDSDASSKLGALATAFLFTYILLSPVFALLADRFSRWWLVGIGVILWSLASGASGFATSYLMLLVTRCFVGVGEAAYVPIAPTMISDLYPVSIRGRVLAWFYAAIPVGSALGFALGGQVAAVGEGMWRWAFYAVVPPGLLLGFLCFFFRDPLRGQADPGAVTGKRHTSLKDIMDLAKIPSYVLNTLGMAAFTFASGGLAYWMPTYLKECEVAPIWGIDPSTLFGAIVALAGLTATMAGGITGDWLRKRFSGAYLVVSGVTMILAFPLVICVLYAPFPLNWFVIFLAIFLMFFNTGPTNAVLANVTHPAVRASGFAVNVLVIHLLGDAISPWVIGKVRDRTESLHWGFAIVALMCFAGGALWIWGARYLDEDTRLAPTRLN